MEMLHMASHSGSHIDAPLHKIKGGASISDLPLETFQGLAVIADLRDSKANQPIDATRLQQALANLELTDRIVLVATGWGEKRARTAEWLHDSPFLSPDGAQWLVEQQVRAVGIDHYSIGGSREPGNAQTHQILLGANRWIVEELRFPDEVFALQQPIPFWCLPIHLRDHSGAFCRPVMAVD